MIDRSRTAGRSSLLVACVGVGLAGVPSLQGQTPPRSGVEVGAIGGLLAPTDPSFGPDETAFDVSPAPLFGGRLGYVAPFGLFVEGEVAFATATLEPDDGESRDLSTLLYGANVGYDFASGGAARPYLTAGIGAISWTLEDAENTPDGETEVDVSYNVGAGLRVFLSRQLALRFEARDRFAPDGLSATRRKVNVGLPPPETRDPNHNFELVAGLTLRLSGGPEPVPETIARADSDGDGVLDSEDRCPQTPAIVEVDARGCPTDSDADGVPDGLDRCPDTPAGADVSEEGCEAEPEPTDADEDGVPDPADSCPGTPAGVAVDEGGCAVSALERELLERGRLLLDGVDFASGSAELAPGSEEAVDAVGPILLRHPDLQIEIQGHTDAVGPADFNQDLSARRAQAVLEVFLQRFPDLDRARFRVRGYGEELPVASNTTEEGRERNRRVELVVLDDAGL